MRLLSLLFLAISFCSDLCFGQSDCQTLAKNELENIYCQITATPEGRTLPSFSDFRRNSAQVQTLLLKGPAQRLGITLPTGATAPQKVVQNPPPKPRSKPARAEETKSSALKPAIPDPILPPPLTHTGLPQNNLNANRGLQGCKLRNTEIVCKKDLYLLTHNRQNQQLQPGVLEDTNRLNLPSFQGSLNNKVAVNNYLADSYQLYIDKMLLIGLGGSTMTYTKFHYTFWELVEKRENFANRVSTMYEFIKKDKASMAVKTRYGDDLPGGIDWCMELSEEVIVCDNGKKNWVYVRQS